MKPPTVASRKKVSPDNLARLGAERLATILYEVASTRPELKRRLRMELAAEHGAEHLAPEIDKRLSALETSRSKISWRQRRGFVRDLDALRLLITEQLARLDRPGAASRLLRLLGAARRVRPRLRDKEGELAAALRRAAVDLGGLLHVDDVGAAGEVIAQGLYDDPGGWADWLGAVISSAPAELAATVLQNLSTREKPPIGGAEVVRRLADASGNIDAYKATFTPATLKTPGIAAEVARRLLSAGRLVEAGALLTAASPRGLAGDGREAWEGAWIEFLDASGQLAAAQDARWASFERTLSPAPLRAMISGLADFDDVEALDRAFRLAAASSDAAAALRLFIEWPALGEAARLIERRSADIVIEPSEAEASAGRLAPRHPRAAKMLLARAAELAVGRRDIEAAKRLREAADALEG